MRKIFLPILLAAALVSACAGDDNSPAPVPVPPVEPAPKPHFGAQISFGDSLSDVGTYAVGTVKALGGGKFTINGDYTRSNPAFAGLNWTEVLAARLGLPAPCAAQTGLDGIADQGFWVPAQNHAGCFGYGQGGARVTQAVGPGNKLTGSPLGALTVPVQMQIANHLALSGGKFKSDDLVLVMAGGNDLLLQLGALSAGAAAAGNVAGREEFYDRLATALAKGATHPVTAELAIRSAMRSERARQGSTQTSVIEASFGTAVVQPGNLAVMNPVVKNSMLESAQASALMAAAAAAQQYATVQGPNLVPAMATAGAELAKLVKNEMLAKGARYVVVNNLPDVARTPAGLKSTPEVQALMAAMAQAFNAQLRDALSAEAGVTLVDMYALSQEAAANPSAFGLTNVTDMACDLTPPGNVLGSSLVCNGSNLQAGDVSRYAYADDMHPTPYFYALLASKVAEKMVQAGWL